SGQHTSNSPPGNNGDIKVHMITTDQSDHRNQPKPGCTFYIDGFNFDSHSSGQWQIDGQGQTSGSFGHGTWGPSDSGGNWRSGDMTLAEGHYKVSAWQTLPNDPSGGDKTKVFKTDCGQTSGGGAGEETRGKITAAISGATTFNAALKSRVEGAVTLLASCTSLLLPATVLMLQGDITAATNDSADVKLKTEAAQTALDNLNIAIASGNAVSIALAVTAADTAMTNLQTSIDTATLAKTALNTDFAGVVSVCGSISGGTGGGNGGGGNGGSNVGGQQGSLTGSQSNGGSRSGTGSKSKGNGSGTGTGSKSKNAGNSGSGSAAAGSATGNGSTSAAAGSATGNGSAGGGSANGTNTASQEGTTG